MYNVFINFLLNTGIYTQPRDISEVISYSKSKISFKIDKIHSKKRKAIVVNNYVVNYTLSTIIFKSPIQKWNKKVLGGAMLKHLF